MASIFKCDSDPSHPVDYGTINNILCNSLPITSIQSPGRSLKAIKNQTSNIKFSKFDEKNIPTIKIWHARQNDNRMFLPNTTPPAATMFEDKVKDTRSMTLDLF